MWAEASWAKLSICDEFESFLMIFQTFAFFHFFAFTITKDTKDRIKRQISKRWNRPKYKQWKFNVLSILNCWPFNQLIWLFQFLNRWVECRCMDVSYHSTKKCIDSTKDSTILKNCLPIVIECIENEYGPLHVKVNKKKISYKKK